MSLVELKSGLHLFIDNIQDDELLQLYYNLLQREVTKKEVWEELSEAEKNAIDESLKDVEAGRFVTNDSVMTAVNEIINA
jgi:hypothetical protein